MNYNEKHHLAALVREAVQADRRNDTTARNMARHEAVNTYAYCTAAEWARLIEREEAGAFHVRNAYDGIPGETRHRTVEDDAGRLWDWGLDHLPFCVSATGNAPATTAATADTIRAIDDAENLIALADVVNGYLASIGENVAHETYEDTADRLREDGNEDGADVMTCAAARWWAIADRPSVTPNICVRLAAAEAAAFAEAVNLARRDDVGEDAAQWRELAAAASAARAALAEGGQKSDAEEALRGSFSGPYCPVDSLEELIATCLM